MTFHDPVVVIDAGAATVKAGYAGDDLPHVVIPSVYGCIRHSAFLASDPSRKQCYVGQEALSLRGIMGIKQLVDSDGDIRHSSALELFYSHILQNALAAPPPETPPFLLAMNTPPGDTHAQAQCEALFEKLGVPAIGVRRAAELAALCQASAPTAPCVVVDLGQNATTVVPLLSGRAVPGAARSLRIGGDALTERLMGLLMENGYPFVTTAEREYLRDIKERYCRVLEPDGEAKDPKGEVVQYELPDGQVVPIGEERTLAPEVLFNPSLAGVVGPGLAERIYSAINHCDSALQQDFYARILLVGGTSHLSGLDARLKTELRKLVPSSIEVTIHAYPDRKYAAWTGGSIYASTSAFAGCCCTKAEYAEFGSGILARNFVQP